MSNGQNSFDMGQVSRSSGQKSLKMFGLTCPTIWPRFGSPISNIKKVGQQLKFSKIIANDLIELPYVLAKCFDHIMKIMKVGQKVNIYFKYFSYDPYIICMKFGTFLMSLGYISYNQPIMMT